VPRRPAVATPSTPETVVPPHQLSSCDRDILAMAHTVHPGTFNEASLRKTGPSHRLRRCLGVSPSAGLTREGRGHLLSRYVQQDRLTALFLLSLPT
jgi:hypothetical protein